MIHVQLPQFEGPLELLLFLIRRDEIDIHNIPIHYITQQYFEHIKRMRELDLEVAGEFVAMAATLIHIKSRMLLPQYDESGDPLEETADPRRELVQKLVEYQKFQQASKTLNERPLLGRDVWPRGLREELPVEEGDIVLEEGGLFSLISIYRKVMRQMARSVHNVRAKGQSIASRILQIRDKFIVGQRVLMSELLDLTERNSTQILITFLSLLELTKMGFIHIFQSDTYGEIYIDTRKPVERNVIERVEEYDQQPGQAAALANALAGSPREPDASESLTGLGLESEADSSVQSEKTEAISLNEELASDQEILDAEIEMGVVDSDIDLSFVDRTLENFSLGQLTLEEEPQLVEPTVIREPDVIVATVEAQKNVSDQVVVVHDNQLPEPIVLVDSTNDSMPVAQSKKNSVLASMALLNAREALNMFDGEGGWDIDSPAALQNVAHTPTEKTDIVRDEDLIPHSESNFDKEPESGV